MTGGPGTPKAPACPICGKPVPGPDVRPTFRPFCSRRCKDVDLNRWLGEVYRIPVTPESDEDGDEQNED